jgi:hypothetical protein
MRDHEFAVERRALLLALALMVPLALYGIPYAYASVTSSSYISTSVGTSQPLYAHCNAGDYATGGGGYVAGLYLSVPQVFDGVAYSSSDSGVPNAWAVAGTTGASAKVWVVCQTPITVAGIGVPEFGSLYAAIALGAVVCFVLARQYGGRRSGQATTRA